MTRAYPPSWFAGRLCVLTNRWQELNPVEDSEQLVLALPIGSSSRRFHPFQRGVFDGVERPPWPPTASGICACTRFPRHRCRGLIEAPGRAILVLAPADSALSAASMWGSTR